MLKVTKVQPIATHRDYTRKDRENFQEVYCKAQEKYAQAEDYRAAEEAVQRCKDVGKIPSPYKRNLNQGYRKISGQQGQDFHSVERDEERFEEGKHYFKLEGDVLREFKRESANCGIATNVNILYLWTRRGASLHSKMLGTDKDVKFFLQNVLTVKLLHAIIKAYQVKKLHRKKRGGER